MKNKRIHSDLSDYLSLNYFIKAKKLLEDYPDDIDITYNDGIFFNFAISENNVEMLSTLLEYDSYRLINAAADGNVNKIKEILDSGKADINFKENRHGHGYTALHLACLNGHDETIKMLVAKGAKQNVINNKGYTPKEVYKHQHVTGEKYDPIYEELVSGLTIQDYHNTLEYKIAKHKLQAILQDAADTFSISSAIQEVLDRHSICLQEESDIDEQELIDAAADGNVDQIQQILDKGKVDINFQEARYGHTALHLASQNGHDEAMNLLIQRGADQEITNNKGLKPNEVYKLQHIIEEQLSNIYQDNDEDSQDNLSDIRATTGNDNVLWDDHIHGSNKPSNKYSEEYKNLAMSMLQNNIPKYSSISKAIIATQEELSNHSNTHHMPAQSTLRNWSKDKPKIEKSNLTLENLQKLPTVEDYCKKLCDALQRQEEKVINTEESSFDISPHLASKDNINQHNELKIVGENNTFDVHDIDNI